MHLRVFCHQHAGILATVKGVDVSIKHTGRFPHAHVFNIFLCKCRVASALGICSQRGTFAARGTYSSKRYPVIVPLSKHASSNV